MAHAKKEKKGLPEMMPKDIIRALKYLYFSRFSGAIVT